MHASEDALRPSTLHRNLVQLRGSADVVENEAIGRRPCLMLCKIHLGIDLSPER